MPQQGGAQAGDGGRGLPQAHCRRGARGDAAAVAVARRRVWCRRFVVVGASSPPLVGRAGAALAPLWVTRRPSRLRRPGAVVARGAKAAPALPPLCGGPPRRRRPAAPSRSVLAATAAATPPALPRRQRAWGSPPHSPPAKSLGLPPARHRQPPRQPAGASPRP